MTIPSEAIDLALEVLTGLVRDDDALSSELEASVEPFFHGTPPATDPGETLYAARRHLEWFLLERHSPSLFGTPVERLLDQWSTRVDEPLVERALLDSFVGVFEVEEVREGAGAWLRDLAGFGSYAIVEPTRATPLEKGDLLVGRLFPAGDGVHQISRAVGRFRDERLSRALQADLGRVRENADRRVLRLSQQELEVMFWGAGQVLAEEVDPIEHARRFLAQSGLSQDRIRLVFRLLATSEPPVDGLVHHTTDALGAALDELAFDTAVDLESARRVLAVAWPDLFAGGAKRRSRAPAPGSNGSPPDARAAVEAFDKGRAAGVDLDMLIDDLERDLAIAADDAGLGELDEEELSPAPDFPGVVSAMVEEFLWDISRDPNASVPERTILRPLEQYAERIGVFEELNATELLRFTTFWVHERDVLGGADEARRLLDALHSFCTWVESVHEVPLERDFGPTLEQLRESLPRVVELNRMLGAPPESEPGELYEVRGDERGRYAGLRDRAGNESRAAPEPGLAERLRPGDRLRGRISLEGDLHVFRCYPPEAEGLL